MRLVTDEEAVQWEALARQHGFVNEAGDLIPGRFSIERVTAGQLYIRLITPAPAAPHTEDLRQKTPPVLLDRTPNGETILPGRWCHFVLEHLSQDTILPPEVRAWAGFLCRRGVFPNVLLPAEVETVAFKVADEKGNWVFYEALPPLTQVIFQWEVLPEQLEG